MKLLLYSFFCGVLILFVGCGTIMLNMKSFDYPVTTKYTFSILLKPSQIKSKYSGWMLGEDPTPEDFKSVITNQIFDLTSKFFQDDSLNPRLILTPSVRSFQVKGGNWSWSDASVTINITWTFTTLNGDTIANYFVQGDTISNFGSIYTKNGNEEERFRKVLSEVFQKSFQLFNSSYLLREFDLCEPLYSHNIAHQKSASMEILSKCKDEIERQAFGTMMMCYAARTANMELMEFLIQQRIAVNETEKFSGLRPIHVAASFGNVKIVRLLLDNGTDINTESAEERTPLLYAGYQGHENTWQLLLDRGARIEAPNDSNFYQNALLYEMFGDYLVKVNSSRKAAESYLIASNNFQLASAELEKLSDELSSDSWWSLLGEVVVNTVLAYDAQLRARQQAEFNAAISPTGKGRGMVFYKQYHKSNYTEAEMEAEYSRISEECKEKSVKCKQLADSLK